MLFGFRGIRVFQVILALAALALGVGLAVTLKAFTDTDNYFYLITAVFLGLCFLWMFSSALRAPTSFVAVAEDRTRIRFAGFVDTIVLNRDVDGVQLVRRPFWYGLGVRLTPGGVSLLTGWGEVAEFFFREPVRVWLIPRVIPIKTRRLGVSVRNPALLAQRFGPPGAGSSPGKQRTGKMGRRGSRTR